MKTLIAVPCMDTVDAYFAKSLAQMARVGDCIRQQHALLQNMLDCTLDSPESLAGYAVHPAHVAVANGIVRPNTELRTCLDYEY